MVIANTDKFDQRILDLVNQERAKYNAKPLILSQKLDTAADAYSNRMATGDFFSHFDPKDGSGPGDRIEKTGYKWFTWGENIAAGQSTPEQVFQAWIASPGHRSNILNPSFAHIGIGYAYLANDGGNVPYHHYWTQDFGAGDPNPGQYIPESDSSTPPPPTSNPLPATEIQGTNGDDNLTGDASGQTILGLGGNDIIRGLDGADKIFGGSGNDQLYGDAGDDQLFGDKGNDTLTGGDGKDLLVGISPSQTADRQQRDVLIGGASADTFQLGNASRAYYNDRQDNTLGQGDYALIQDFSKAQGDVIQLQGSPNNYDLAAYAQGVVQGTAIFLTTPGQDELIAVVQNVNVGDLSLLSNSFSFV